jgi:hypothetical protein
VIGGAIPPVGAPLSSSTRINSNALQALAQMTLRVLIVSAATPERPHARVPFVMATSAEARARYAEGRVSSGKIALGIYHPHYELGLGALDVADEWPKEM